MKDKLLTYQIKNRVHQYLCAYQFLHDSVVCAVDHNGRPLYHNAQRLAEAIIDSYISGCCAWNSSPFTGEDTSGINNVLAFTCTAMDDLLCACYSDNVTMQEIKGRVSALKGSADILKWQSIMLQVTEESDW